MPDAILINLVETISHEFVFTPNDIPDDVPLDDPQAILEWANENGRLDYSQWALVGDQHARFVDETE